MHRSLYEWTRDTVERHGLAERSVLEVGSKNVNGTVRDWFRGAYLGVDIEQGPCVDMIANGEDLPFPDNAYGVVVSSEMLEHCAHPWLAINEMVRVCEPGGNVIVTARGYDERGCWEVHSYPYDYWRFGEHTIPLMLSDAGALTVESVKDPEGPGWFVVGWKPTPVDEMPA